MLTCPKCGTDNMLGRVFCAQCGSKLDLTAMTSEAVADSVRQNWFSMHWRKLVALVAVILLAMVGLALWPNAKPIGKEGKPVGGRRVAGDIGMLERLVKGQKVTRNFNEEDINGYFEFAAKKDLKNLAITVDIQEGWCSVRFVRSLGKIDLKFYEIPAKLTYDLKCSVSGGRLYVRSVTMGHMPLFPPFKTMVVKDAYKQVSGLKEWKALASTISEVTMAGDSVTLVAKK